MPALLHAHALREIEGDKTIRDERERDQHSALPSFLHVRERRQDGWPALKLIGEKGKNLTPPRRLVKAHR